MKTIMREVDRRSFFRYLGNAALLYPFMRTLFETEVFGANTQKRAVFFYFPSGVVFKHFHPTVMGPNFDLQLSTKPLEAVRKEILMLKGVEYKCNQGHEAGAAYCMTGGGGVSIDTYLGEKFKAGTIQPVVRLGTASLYDTGTDSRMSFFAQGQPSPMDDNPKAAFKKLFGANASGFNLLADQGKADQSVLDFCVDDMKSLQSRLGTIEKQKLDIHLQSLRELERRIQAANKPIETNPGDPTKPDMPSASCTRKVDFSKATIPDDENQALQYAHNQANFGVIASLNMDIMVQALACGITNVGFLQYTHKDAPIRMDFAGGPNIAIGQHTASHHGDNDGAQLQYGNIQAWFMSEYAKLIQKLGAVSEGDKSLLYNSVALAFSEIGESNYHTMQNVALVMAGQAGGAIKTGRAIDGTGSSHNQVLVSILQAMGVNENSFGSAAGGSGPMPGILG